MSKLIEYSIHPYAPYIPKNSTKLIIGTIAPYRFCKTPQKLYHDDVNFYYGSHDNTFWHLISQASNTEIELEYKNTKNAIKQRKYLLNTLNTGITDIVEICIHNNKHSDDNSLDILKLKPLDKLLSQNNCKNIETFIYTSNFVIRQMNNFADKKRHESWSDNSRKQGTVTINRKKYKVIVLYSPSPLALIGLGDGGADKRRIQYEEIFRKL